jgi:uncharacterized protein
MNADDVIRHLDLRPHPEGGHYREIHRDRPQGGGRGAVTSIYFLLRAGETSRWHRVDGTEVFHFHGGAPLSFSMSPDARSVETQILGMDLAAGERPQIVVPPHCWQAAKSLGAWTLVGCTVAPAFLFETFEMAPPGWEPAG